VASCLFYICLGHTSRFVTKKTPTPVKKKDVEGVIPHCTISTMGHPKTLFEIELGLVASHFEFLLPLTRYTLFRHVRTASCSPHGRAIESATESSKRREAMRRSSSHHSLGSIVELARLEAVEVAMKDGERVAQGCGRQHLLLAELVLIEEGL